jgi:hypothetical protein
MIANDTTDVSYCETAFLLFGTLCEQDTSFVPLRALCVLENGPAILAKAFEGVVFTTGQIILQALVAGFV